MMGRVESNVDGVSKPVVTFTVITIGFTPPSFVNYRKFIFCLHILFVVYHVLDCFT